MKTLKLISIIVMISFTICLFFYSYVLRVKVNSLDNALMECDRLMEYYSDSADVEKGKYELQLEQLQEEIDENNRIIREYIEKGKNR